VTAADLEILFEVFGGWLYVNFFTPCVRHKNLDGGWNGIGGFAGIIARICGRGLADHELGLCLLPSLNPTSAAGGEHMDTPLLVVIDHPLIVVPKHVPIWDDTQL
jgi:hypothetical protein